MTDFKHNFNHKGHKDCTKVIKKLYPSVLNGFDLCPKSNAEFSMKIGICSDIHLHRHDQHRQIEELTGYINSFSETDLLICAGDISHSTKEVTAFLKSIHVPCPKCWVPGNHDLWVIKKESLWDSAAYRYRYAFPRISRKTGWHYLPAAGLRLPGFEKEVIGNTGWFTGTGYSEWFDAPADTRDEELARKMADALHTDFEKSGEKDIIVVTHHLPAYFCLPPNRQDEPAEVNRYMEKTVQKYADRITLLVHGHKHRRYGPEKINKIFCMANPFGYPHQHCKPGDGFRIIDLK